jgi:hypothetical protein
MARLPDQLPAARATPLDRRGAAAARLPAAQRRLLEEASGGADLFFLARTGTTVDVGQWLRNGRLWAAVTATELLLFAAGRVPFVQKAPCAQLRQSLYNPFTGDVVLAPGHGLQVRRVKLAALDGCRLLAQIGRPSENNQNR